MSEFCYGWLNDVTELERKAREQNEEIARLGKKLSTLEFQLMDLVVLLKDVMPSQRITFQEKLEELLERISRGC